MKEINSGIQKRLKFFALLMGIIMFSYIILYSIPLIQKDIDYKLRNIETDIQTAAYEYNAYQEIIEFNEFEVYDLDDFIIRFEGSRNFTVSEMNFYDIFDENEEVNVKFTIEFNKETTELMAYLEYWQFENVF